MPFTDATHDLINDTLIQAKKAFEGFKAVSGKTKSAFLLAIVAELESQKSAIISSATKETNLPEPRITGEFGRTIGQLKAFAQLALEGSWVEARIDTAQPDRLPLPKPDIRKMLVPIGPVVVFGASNFPLAFSTAGGDTASALAAGCPVIVKAHPAHAQTSELVAECIRAAVDKVELPKGVFSHLHGATVEVGTALVNHPLTKAVGFTGSFAGGKALFDLANRREEPIPVFSEMGSTNPVFLLPSALKSRGKEIANTYAGSITLSAGQFCTNPGMMLGMKGEELDSFLNDLGIQIRDLAPSEMLHPGIASAYQKNRAEALEQNGVALVSESSVSATPTQGIPTIATVSFADFVTNPTLAEEVFGPYSLLIQAENRDDLFAAIDAMPGQLTATVIGDDDDLKTYADFILKLRDKVGRLILNGVPTGVEVCPSMHHGGPYPSTTDARFTSVGIDAVKRFVRPVSFQNFPTYLLPEELRNENPLNIWRLVNGEFTEEAI